MGYRVAISITMSIAAWSRGARAETRLALLARRSESERLMTAPAAPKKRRVWRLLALQVIVLIGGLLLAEAAWRIVLRVRGTPYDSAAGAQELERQMSRARDFVPRLGPDAIGKPEDTRAQIRVTHPFLGWENLGGLEQLHLEASRPARRCLRM
jgi:hypothetical protein